MNSTKPDTLKELIPPLGSSGFPFQTAVAAAIRSVGHVEIEEEVGWQDSDGSHNFLDIVASVGQARICIECKALRGEKLVFLLPQSTWRQTADVSAIHLGRMQDSSRRPVVMYGVSQTAPLTYESLYCVAIGRKSGESRLIEREAQPLVRGTEEYARDRCSEFTPEPPQVQSVLCIPVLVTTASLLVAEYDPLAISLKDGIYQAREEHLRPVEFVRFTKQFTAHGPERTRLRTVIIAQAAHVKNLVIDLGNVSVNRRWDDWVKLHDSVAIEIRRR